MTVYERIKAMSVDEMFLTAKEKEEIEKEWKQMLESEASTNGKY